MVPRTKCRRNERPFPPRNNQHNSKCTIWRYLACGSARWTFFKISNMANELPTNDDHNFETERHLHSKHPLNGLGAIPIICPTPSMYNYFSQTKLTLNKTKILLKHQNPNQHQTVEISRQSEKTTQNLPQFEPHELHTYNNKPTHHQITRTTNKHKIAPPRTRNNKPKANIQTYVWRTIRKKTSPNS